MPKVSFKLDAAAEKKLKAVIAAKIGAKARQFMYRLHTNILERTPMNSGRTLGSWAASAGQKMLIDIGDDGSFGWDFGKYEVPTNRLAVGNEPGREVFEQRSLATLAKINFEKNPYRVFYIANGAKLDSGADFAPDAHSSLPQGPGSRAAMQEFGRIAGYDFFASSGDTKIFNFEPRGTLAFHMAIHTTLRDYGRA